MNGFSKTLILAAALTFSATCISRADSLAPAHLTTDMLEYTETVWSCGYPTSASLSEYSDFTGSFQTAEIHSSRPSFGWILQSDGSSVLQVSYRVLVATAPELLEEGRADMWDSGAVRSSNSVSVKYSGKELQPSTVYYWTVKVVDNKGNASAYAPARSFITAASFDTVQSRYPLVKEWQEAELLKGDGDVLFADFGKDAYSQLVLKVCSDEETVVTVHLGEACKDGKVDRKPGGTIRYTSYELRLLKGEHVYRIANRRDRRNAVITPGRHTHPVLMPEYAGEVYPFRYCEIEGVPSRNVKMVAREAVNYAFNDNASYFHSSDDILNQVWDLCKYSIKMTSALGIYIDGDRERIPYEADALINQLSHYCVDREYAMGRYSVDYLCTDATWPTEWILQALIMAWNDYMYTGDKGLLEKNYTILKDRTLVELAREDGLISTRTGLQTIDLMDRIGYKGDKIKDIVDWPQSGAFGIGKEEAGEADGYKFCDYNTVVNAFHYRALEIASEIASVLGKSDDAESFRNRAAKVCKAFNSTFLTGPAYRDGDTTAHCSLHANMMPYAFGMVPQKNKAAVMDFIRSRGMACSVYGTQFLFDALYEGCEDEYALELLTATHSRSWYNMIAKGSTVTWEAWDGKFKSNLDWNHAWGSAPANIIPRKLMGVEPLEPGFSLIRIKPQPGRLGSAELVLPTVRGDVKVSFVRKDGVFSLDATVPANAEAVVYLPCTTKKYEFLVDGVVTKGEREGNFVKVKVGSGDHQFSIR